MPKSEEQQNKENQVRENILEILNNNNVGVSIDTGEKNYLKGAVKLVVKAVGDATQRDLTRNMEMEALFVSSYTRTLDIICQDGGKLIENVALYKIIQELESIAKDAPEYTQKLIKKSSEDVLLKFTGFTREDLAKIETQNKSAPVSQDTGQKKEDKAEQKGSKDTALGKKDQEQQTSRSSFADKELAKKAEGPQGQIER